MRVLELLEARGEDAGRGGGRVALPRDAQAHPEKYENLQVRVCGWNVRWNDMSKVEQDAYIRRAENVMQGF